MKKITDYILTTFDKKVVLNKLSAHNVKGLYLAIKEEELSYTVVYEYKGMLFCCQTPYSMLGEKKYDDSLEDYTKRIEQEIQEDKTFVEELMFTKNIDRSKEEIAKRIVHAINSEIIIYKEHGVVVNDISAIEEQLTSKIFKMVDSITPLEAYKTIMTKYNLTKEGIKKVFSNPDIEKAYIANINIYLEMQKD